MDAFIARQPIFDKDKQVYGYELLFRNSDINAYDSAIASEKATAMLLVNSYITFGIDHLVGDGRAFINFDDQLIRADIPQLLDPEKIIVEMLETSTFDSTFNRKIVELKEKGYTIAIDDYVEGMISKELMYLVDIIKVDFFKNSREEIKKIVKKYPEKNLLAEKIETYEEFEWASNLDFRYFQGYFFSKPLMLKKKSMEAFINQYIQIVDELETVEPDFAKIAKIIQKDPPLAYKLLKLVNSRLVSDNDITSIQHAVAMLGINAFKKWISLAMMQHVSAGKPSELFRTALIRTRFMELVALESSLKDGTDELILIGILSLVDAMLDQDMEEILLSLPVSGIIKNTILGNFTKFLPPLEMIRQYEKGEFQGLRELSESIGFDIERLPDTYYDAVSWSEELISIIK